MTSQGAKVIKAWLDDSYSVTLAELSQVVRESRRSYYIRAAADAACRGDRRETQRWYDAYEELL